MFTKRMFVVFLFFSGFAAIVNSCDKEEDSPAPDPNPMPSTEFVAADSDFAGFRTWKVVVDLKNALSDDGRAHTDAARTVWIKQANAALGQNGQYPIGTILVKEVQGGYGIVAMVKRGGTYNSSHNGWEWFHLDTAGKITSRNSSSVCNNCHAKVKNADYVFTR